jgi:HlyD family secretion protein
MDIARPARRPLALRYLPLGFALAALTAAAVLTLPWLLHRSVALPSIERNALVLDVARRGTLVRAVRAPGLLTPDRVQIVATTAGGLVDALPIRAGTRVGAGSVIAVLQNPDLDAAVADVRAQLDAARADVRSAREEASAAQLDQQAAYRTAAAEAKRSAEEARSYTSLHASGLVGDLSYRETLIKADENRALAGIAERKIDVGAAGQEAKVAAAVAKVEQLEAQLAARRAVVETLVVRAGSAGIVESVAVEQGQRLASGTELARIAEARDLKAVLQVAESDLHGIAPGMPAAIDTNGEGTIAGRVARIAPAAQNGTVAVDVTLADVRRGIRPDQNVDGTIELSRVLNALSIARPASAADNSSVTLYKLSPDGTRAVRTTVRLATGSLERVGVIGGLAPGDTVIVSDMSTYDAPVLRIQ